MIIDYGILLSCYNDKTTVSPINLLYWNIYIKKNMDYRKVTRMSQGSTKIFLLSITKGNPLHTNWAWCLILPPLSNTTTHCPNHHLRCTQNIVMKRVEETKVMKREIKPSFNANFKFLTNNWKTVKWNNFNLWK